MRGLCTFLDGVLRRQRPLRPFRHTSIVLTNEKQGVGSGFLELFLQMCHLIWSEEINKTRHLARRWKNLMKYTRMFCFHATVMKQVHFGQHGKITVALRSSITLVLECISRSSCRTLCITLSRSLAAAICCSSILTRFINVSLPFLSSSI